MAKPDAAFVKPTAPSILYGHLSARQRGLVLVIAAAAALLTAYVDHLTPSIHFAPFATIIVIIVTAVAGLRAGLASALLTGISSARP